MGLRRSLISFRLRGLNLPATCVLLRPRSDFLLDPPPRCEFARFLDVGSRSILVVKHVSFRTYVFHVHQRSMLRTWDVVYTFSIVYVVFPRDHG